MISRIDHISIAVKDYPKALHFFKDILGAVTGAGSNQSEIKNSCFAPSIYINAINSSRPEKFIKVKSTHKMIKQQKGFSTQ
jgi:extradiol dioxygenase family protein